MSVRWSRPGVDPRALVVAGSLVALALVATSAMLLVRSADEAHRKIDHIQMSVEVPLGHLTDALEADTQGGVLFQEAVAASGRFPDDVLGDLPPRKPAPPA